MSGDAHTLRAPSGEMSFCPTCTPLNPAARHRSARSFMISTASSGAIRFNSRATDSVFRGRFSLSRNCTSRTPPANNSAAYASGSEQTDMSRIAYSRGNVIIAFHSMWRYIGVRLAYTLPVIWLVVSVVFLLIHLVPGDPIQTMLGEGAATADIEATRHAYGLDVPIGKQYVNYW